MCDICIMYTCISMRLVIPAWYIREQVFHILKVYLLHIGETMIIWFGLGSARLEIRSSILLHHSEGLATIYARVEYISTFNYMLDERNHVSGMTKGSATPWNEACCFRCQFIGISLGIDMFIYWCWFGFASVSHAFTSIFYVVGFFFSCF